MSNVFFRKVGGSWWPKSYVLLVEKKLGCRFDDDHVEKIESNHSPGTSCDEVRTEWQARKTGAKITVSMLA
jgi:hypothetical protein